MRVRLEALLLSPVIGNDAMLVTCLYMEFPLRDIKIGKLEHG